MILYINDPINSTRKLLERINSFIYDIKSTYNNQYPFCIRITNREQNHKSTVIHNNLNKITYNISLPKDVKDLYKENFNLKEPEEDARWKDPTIFID